MEVKPLTNNTGRISYKPVKTMVKKTKQIVWIQFIPFSLSGREKKEIEILLLGYSTLCFASPVSVKTRPRMPRRDRGSPVSGAVIRLASTLPPPTFSRLT